MSEARPCVLIESGSRFAAEGAARAAGFEPQLVLGKRDCARALGAERDQARALSLEVAVIHAPDWDRQPLPQLYELAALRLAVSECVVLSGAGSVAERLERAELRARARRIAGDAALASARLGAELAHFVRSSRTPPQHPRLGPRPDAVLAVWPRTPGHASVGGAVTHMSGILAAFRRAGLRVGLLALGEPPPQLADATDDLEIVAAPPRGVRLTNEIESVCSNREARAAGRRLAARLEPALVYQRHEVFVTHGADLALEYQAPLVLEWNNSQAWAHANWHKRSPVKSAFNPLAERMERYVLQRANLIASVSEHASQMALKAGARAGDVLVLPNGVDVIAIDRAAAAAVRERNGDEIIVGWVGSFDTWHGAEVLVKSLMRLPDGVHALLVGDGPQRASCESLARELGVLDRVRFTGAVPHDEAVRQLAGCDVLASPHVPMEGRPFFGSPTKVFEYMAIGRPIVASRLEQIGEILHDHETAILVAPGDADDLARGISTTLALPQRGQQLGIEARREAERRHTWDARVAAVLERVGDGSATGAMRR